MENTLGRYTAQGIFIILRLFKRFDFASYDLARLECCQITAFSRSKNLAVDDGFCCSIDGSFRQVRFRIGNGVADVFADSINKGEL